MPFGTRRRFAPEFGADARCWLDDDTRRGALCSREMFITQHVLTGRVESKAAETVTPSFARTDGGSRIVSISIVECALLNTLSIEMPRDVASRP